MSFYTSNPSMSIGQFDSVIAEYKDSIDENVRSAKYWERKEMTMMRWPGLFKDLKDDLNCYSSFEYDPEYGYTVTIEGIYLTLTW